jgi:hypothetical protein
MSGLWKVGVSGDDSKEEVKCKRQLSVNEDRTYKEIINCTNADNFKMLENTCSKLDVNGKMKLLKYEMRT